MAERKCTCASDERYECFAIRYTTERLRDGSDECCECVCHDDFEHELEDEDWSTYDIEDDDRWVILPPVIPPSP